MTRDRVVIPMVKKKKLGTLAERTKGKPLPEIEVTQYALEQLQKRMSKLEIAHNANGKELKAAQIQLNMQGVEIKRLRERVERGQSE